MMPGNYRFGVAVVVAVIVAVAVAAVAVVAAVENIDNNLVVELNIDQENTVVRSILNMSVEY